VTGAEWPRPVPLVGDPTSASQRAAEPTGWAMGEEVLAALHRVVGARRDVRRFRPDPVPGDVLERVLTAAHAAPSVGHSQPWRFLVVQDAAIRDRAAVLTDRERLRQAAQLEPDAARRLLDLQLEGVREAPLGVVVCCDRRTPAAGVLGRATFPDADLWSCAAAVQNLWLAARAEGLGLGWVTLFRPEDLSGLLGLPDGVVTLGWLCLGWPDERPPAPGLERAGWSRRLPLSDVVLRDRWPAEDGGAPAAPPSHLRAPGREAVVAARDRADRLLTPPGSLGVLDRAVDGVVAAGGGATRGGTLLLAAADHPVAGRGVSAYSPAVTRDVGARRPERSTRWRRSPSWGVLSWPSWRGWSRVPRRPGRPSCWTATPPRSPRWWRCGWSRRCRPPSSPASAAASAGTSSSSGTWAGSRSWTCGCAPARASARPWPAACCSPGWHCAGTPPASTPDPRVPDRLPSRGGRAARRVLAPATGRQDEGERPAVVDPG
jgi:5,6-dimethylbenzimidazole synthase